MRRGRRVSHGVEHGAATDGDDVRLPAKRRVVQALVDGVEMARVVLDLLTARKHQHRSGHPQLAVGIAGVGLDICEEPRMRPHHAVVHHHHEVRRVAVRPVGQNRSAAADWWPRTPRA